MKIAFTSCMDALRQPQQPIWRQIADEAPDALALLGDQIYMDWGELGEARWRRSLERSGDTDDAVLRAFATDMHQRYALQWAVPDFQRLVVDLRLRRGPEALLMVWDDHDFAWNNSLGAGEPGDRHTVPPAIKGISRALFQQFEQQLHHAEQGAAYPDLLPVWEHWREAASGPGLEKFAHLAAADASGSAWPFALLDNRWYSTRLPRDRKNPAAPVLGPAQCTVLGAGQRARLQALLQQEGAGLLLVFAGQPARHHYLLSAQGWSSEQEGSYPEYAELLDAKRPVLFVAGDIHTNEWGGRLLWNDAAGQRHASEVLQVCASAAAIDGPLWIRFPPCYGLLTLAGTPQDGRLDLRLMRCVDGVWAAQYTRSAMAFNARRWQSDALEGAAAELPWRQADGEPLAVLSVHGLHPDLPPAWVRQLPRDEDSPTSAAAAPPAFDVAVPDLEALDQLFSDDFPPGSTVTNPLACPLATLVQASTADAPVDGRFRLQARGQAVRVKAGQVRLDEGSHKAAALQALVDDSFARAQRHGRRSVVLFVHGYGKPYAEALLQAYALRAAYPQIEPLLYAWPSGRAGGLLQTVLGYAQVRQAALACEQSLSASVLAFARAARAWAGRGVQAVILARSMGSLALASLFQTDTVANYRAQGLDAVRRIVLSAPALRADPGADPVSLRNLELLAVPPADSAGPGCETVVTLNPQDQTLRYANWLDGWGQPLGLAVPADADRRQALFLDFGAVAGKLHDYLLPALSPAQRALQRQLLCGEVLDLNDTGLLKPVAGKHYRVQY